jgi:hypothetical protein
MTTLVVLGWNVGFNKVKFTRLLQSVPGYSLPHAKSITDAVLEGKNVELQVQRSDAGGLMSAMQEPGARCSAAVPAR